jgi:hypothetical protein
MAKIGIAYPFKADGRGSIEYSNSLIRSIEDSIKQIIFTKRGERPMNLEFGCDVWKVVFDYNIAIIKDLVNVYIRDALQLWEPRINVEDISCTKENEYINVTLVYSIKNSNLPLNYINLQLSN